MAICTAEGEGGSLNNSSIWLKARFSVSDNKGPILAAAFAVSDLRRKLALGLDVVMLIEGEEENGSRGFKDAIHHLKVRIPPLLLWAFNINITSGGNRTHRRNYFVQFVLDWRRHTMHHVWFTRRDSLQSGGRILLTLWLPLLNHVKDLERPTGSPLWRRRRRKS
jgi:hypothetical protein